MSPATFPLETDTGQPFNVLRWLRQRGSAEREWQGGCRWPQQRDRVRLMAATFEAQPTPRARSRRRRKAQKAGRTITAPPLLVAGWLVLITPLEATTWSAADVLEVYRVRGQVELGVKNKEAPAAAQPETQPAPHECGSARPGARDRVGAACTHDERAAHLVEGPHGPRDGGGEQLARERARTGYPPAAGAGHLVGGTPAGVSPPFAPLSL
jgi:hypothetical protein